MEKKDQRLRKCLKCGERASVIGCKVYTKEMRFKGIICEVCASKPPKYRKGITGQKWSCSEGRPRKRGKKRPKPEDDFLNDMEDADVE